MIVEGLTDPEIHALLAACGITDVIADELAKRIGCKRKPSARDTAYMKLIVTLGTREEARTGMTCFN